MKQVRVADGPPVLFGPGQAEANKLEGFCKGLGFRV